MFSLIIGMMARPHLGLITLLVIDGHVVQVAVMSDCLSSDHRPLSVLRALSVDFNTDFNNTISSTAHVQNHWNTASHTTLAAYSDTLDNELLSGHFSDI